MSSVRRSLLVIALLLAAIVHTVGGSVSPVAAAPVPPTPVPRCVAGGPGCITTDPDMEITIAGVPAPEGAPIISAQETFRVRLDPKVPACADWLSDHCYWEISGPRFVNCVWLVDGDPRDARSCPFGIPGLSSATRKGTAVSGEWGPTKCGDRFDTTYIYGGPANVSGATWGERGPLTLSCDVTWTDPRPDFFPGPVFVQLESSIIYCDTGTGALNCPNSRRRTARIWVQLDGDDKSGPAGYTPIEPARFLDTRWDGATVDGREQGGGGFAAGQIRSIRIGGRAGLADAPVAVSYNLTAVRPSANGFVTLYPCTSTPPGASSLNHRAGVTTGNSGVVGLASGGYLCIYAKAATDVVLDITGAFGSTAGAGSVTPARLLDGRADGVTIDGRSAKGGVLVAGTVTPIQVTGRGGVPDSATAVSLNLTAVNPAERGYLTLYPCDQPRPPTSSLNFAPGVVTGNAAIVALADDGRICIYAQRSTYAVVDVTSWMSEGFQAMAPMRFLDSRPGERTVDGRFAGGGRLGPSERSIDIVGRGGISSGVTAVAVNVTSVGASGGGFVTLYPCGASRPDASSLNFPGGTVVGNSAVVPLGAGGQVCVYSRVSTDLVIDVTGVFTP